ncbi:MAG TPA: hypothetical protein VGX28_03490 [Frankiaceae bacterium]|jgi:hypothetical protein|nr:hypothetical protein [Frankiaceae bacterium]
MYRKILALALAVPAMFVAVPTASAAVKHQCSGTYDTQCYTWTCTRNCLEVLCVVWVDVVDGQQSGCFG